MSLFQSLLDVRPGVCRVVCGGERPTHRCRLPPRSPPHRARAAIPSQGAELCADNSTTNCNLGEAYNFLSSPRLNVEYTGVFVFIVTVSLQRFIEPTVLKKHHESVHEEEWRLLAGRCQRGSNVSCVPSLLLCNALA